jgi:hypothetical protein
MRSIAVDRCDALVWIADQAEPLQRASTAIRLDAGVLVVDPVDAPGLDDLLAPLGRVIGACTLLDRHGRDAAVLARRHRCPLLVPSTLAGRGAPLALPGVQERAILAARGWHESALWLPDRRLLVCADALGTIGYFLAADDEPIGVHPLLRPRPPRDALGGLDPDVVCVGHGAPLRESAGAAVEEALRSARRNLPRAWLRGGRYAAGAAWRGRRIPAMPARRTSSGR